MKYLREVKHDCQVVENRGEVAFALPAIDLILRAVESYKWSVVHRCAGEQASLEVIVLNKSAKLH